jgi:hypothetical protein
MRHLWVVYANGTSDVVGQQMLDDLLARNEIAEFYRPSESRWITLGIDPIRGNRGCYVGPERRVTPVFEPRPWVDTSAWAQSTQTVFADSPHRAQTR